MDKVSVLRKWVKNDGLQAPVLLTATSDNFLVKTVGELLSGAFCESGGAGHCGQCNSCRLVEKNAHPEILWGQSDQKTLKIADIRGLKLFVSRSAAGGKRFAVMPRVERLSIPAANALLKTLEDVSPGVRIILTSRWPSRLLATVRSRCLLIRLVGGAVAAPSVEFRWLKKSVLERLASAEDLRNEKAMGGLLNELKEQLEKSGPSRELLASFMSLRDYHRVVAERGNEKLARELLLASLPHI